LGEGRVGVNVLLDTNVLVYHVAGDPAATCEREIREKREP